MKGVWAQIKGAFSRKTDMPRVIKPDLTRAGRSLFEEKLAGLADLRPGAPLSDAQAHYVSQHLPPGFAAMLTARGFAYLPERKYQFLDPLAFAPLVRRMFEGDADLDPDDIHVTGCSAFGVFDLWSPTHFTMRLYSDELQLSCEALATSEFTGPAHLMEALKVDLDNPLRRDPDNRARNLLPNDPDEIEMWDAMTQPLFARAVDTFGALEAGEIFAFDPPKVLFPGVQFRDPLDKMVRASAYDALERALDEALVHLVKYARGRQTPVRRVGRS